MIIARARGLLEAVDRSRLARVARRHSRPGRPLTVVRHEDRWQLGAVTSPRPVAQLVAETLELVVAATREAGADPVVLPARDPHRTRVAVDVTHRPAVVAALQRVGRDTALLVRDGRDRRLVERVPADRLERRRTISLFRTLVAAPGQGALTGEEHGCDLDFHRPDPEVPDAVALPTGNAVTERVPADRMVPGEVEVLGTPRPTWAPFATLPRLEQVDVPVDVVYTWVDGDDPAWRARRDAALAEQGHLNAEAANASRYEDRDELRYSLRSLHLYAEWVNHVWLVTDGQRPDWLVDDHPGLTVVDHRDIFADPAALPTFNSHAIESQLHHIDGLAEHFLYLNDDVYFGRWTRPETFFLGNGQPRFFPSRHQVDPGPPTVDDPPVMAAAKVGRELIRDRFGQLVTQKLKHAPHALRRSVLQEVEEAFPDELDATMRSRFRSPQDVSVPSSFAHHYGFVTGRAVPGDLRYRYLDLVDEALPGWLDRLHRERPLDVFCLNDTTGTPDQLHRRGRMATAFLAAHYPVPSPFERPDGR